MAHEILTVILFFVLCKGIDVNDLKLKQVLVLSRHNVRTPMISNLEMFSPKPWPKWTAEAAYLTERGALLESYMGDFFSEWLTEEKFFDGCPNNNDVIIYSNTKPRTVDSAIAFTKSAFKNCNVTVQHKNTTAMDPVFNPIFHNITETFLSVVINEMQRILHAVDLKDSYAELNRILDIKKSDICKEMSVCDLTLVENKVVYEEGEEPNVRGPLLYGNSIVDSFIMSYYEGKPMEEVAWGEITSPDQWELLTKISRENQNVRFNLTVGSKDLAGPLLNYMFGILKKNSPKFTLLMGHDSNLNPVINALGFNYFELVDQYEPFPIGGKLVFQRWTDGAKDYLKIEYIYQSFLQLRNGDRLSLSNPPKRTLMKLKNCKISQDGFCPWDDFVENILI